MRGIQILHEKKVVYFQLIIKLVFFFVAYGMLFYSLWQASNSISAKTWPKTRGKIIDFGIKDNGDIDGRFYVPAIKYKYIVNSKEYTSEKFSFGTLGAGNKFLSRDFISKFVRNNIVEVSYNPNRHNESVIFTGISYYHIFNICFILLFIYLLHSKVGM